MTMGYVLLRLLAVTTTVRPVTMIILAVITLLFIPMIHALWDGQQCAGEEAPCCTHPNMPWFNKALSETTTEDIELRVCGNFGVANENTLLEVIELFVR